MCECESFSIMDLRTPRNVNLTAFYKRSFAFYTVKNRMPIILTSLIDNLVRNKFQIVDEYGEDAKEELKTVIGEISEFKYEIQTNKPLKLFNSDVPDTKIYDEHLQQLIDKNEHPTHFYAIWLLTECYMYRRLRHIFESTIALKDFDPFRNQKEEAFRSTLVLITAMGELLTDIIGNEMNASLREFVYLLKLNLWGNKCDLSLSLGKVEDYNSLLDTSSLDPFILCDNSKSIWNAISDKSSNSKVVDIILDNAGYEFFTDLCLADYLVSKNLASNVRFYVKTIPWFVSDVTPPDFNWTLEQLKESDQPTLQALGSKWSEYLENGTFQIVESEYWTLPFDYSEMIKRDPDLYRKIAEAKVAIFKGDLNYRKLFGERNWDPTTPVVDALQGFHPTKICVLRTIKADMVCGLREGIAEKVEKHDRKWMETGEWGLIQFSQKVVNIDDAEPNKLSL